MAVLHDDVLASRFGYRVRFTLVKNVKLGAASFRWSGLSKSPLPQEPQCLAQKPLS
jgi:hypothetical protein